MTDGLRRPRVVVAGASGFVGRALMARLSERYDVVGLGRAAGPAPEPGIAWRRCDLFSLRESQAALEGADYAVYLVHSMMPSARLTQGSFADMDLILADNFSRAAEHARVKQIVYLGGLLPADAPLSAHLASRLEVEATLASRSVPLTAIRAGLVVGAAGSSFQILTRLVRRLPIMLCPAWTLTRTQPIALRDAVEILARCIGDPATYGARFDVGGPEVMTYREMIERTAALLGLRRRTVRIPFFSPGLSRLWVSLVTQTPAALVSPLIQSLRHPMVADDRRLQERLGVPGMGFDDAVRLAIAEERAESGRTPVLQRRVLALERRALRASRSVRSVQRLPLPPSRDAAWVAQEYLRWLPRFVWPLLRVETDDAGGCRLRLRPTGGLLLALRLDPEASGADRTLFRIEGGWLLKKRAGQRGRLEFREVRGGRFVLAAIHDYTPTLPWIAYALTQARVHLIVMQGFRRHLQRRCDTAPGRPILPGRGPHAAAPEPPVR